MIMFTLATFVPARIWKKE